MLLILKCFIIFLVFSIVNTIKYLNILLKKIEYWNLFAIKFDYKKKWELNKEFNSWNEEKFSRKREDSKKTCDFWFD